MSKVEDGKPEAARSETEVEGGLRFGHMMAMQERLAHRSLAVETSALVDLLIAKGVISARELDERRQTAEKQEQVRDEKRVLPLLAPPSDKYQVASPPIPCADNLPLCRGACCYLTFHLSPQDLDENVVKWDYFRPYRIRQHDSGACTHLGAGGRCSVYEKRPAVCRSYDCRQDARVWQDYDKRIPAEGIAKLPLITRR